ncbi:hypothetical protein GQ54DRAFT_299598, partial [Martensiomyces pterosporus]
IVDHACQPAHLSFTQLELTKHVSSRIKSTINAGRGISRSTCFRTRPNFSPVPASNAADFTDSGQSS